MAPYKTLCDLCEFKANTTTALLRHRRSRHKSARPVKHLSFHTEDELYQIPDPSTLKPSPWLTQKFKVWLSGVTESINSTLHPKVSGNVFISSISNYTVTKYKSDDQTLRFEQIYSKLMFCWIETSWKSGKPMSPTNFFSQENGKELKDWIVPRIFLNYYWENSAVLLWTASKNALIGGHLYGSKVPFKCRGNASISRKSKQRSTPAPYLWY